MGYKTRIKLLQRLNLGRKVTRRQLDDFPQEDWQYEVKNGDTNLAYLEWLAHKIESETKKIKCTA